MASFFLEIFNLSMAACWIIGAVFTVRMLFVKSMPKWLVCCLWGLVAIRLLLPVTVESNISLVPNQQLELYIPSEDVDENSVFVEESVPTKEEIVNDSTVKVPITNETVSSPVIDEAVSSPVTDEAVSAPVTDEAVSAPVTDENISVPEQNTVIGDQNNVQNGINENGNIQNNVQAQSTVRKNQISVSFVGIAAIVWAVGFCIMTLYSVLSYVLLKRRVRMSFPCGDKVRKGEGIDSPFVLGFLRPRIYIPFGLSQRTEECVIAHERAHLARRDYIIKPLAFLILSVHWFNPFVWVAYILLCRDIEYACDERVVKGLDTDARKAYAFALLECAISHRRIAACPVAFGETGVKERVKNTMKYKKPAFWIIVICVIVCITVAVLFLTTGVSESDNSDTSSDVSDTSSETSDNAENGVYTQVDSFINEGKFEEAYKLLLTVKSEQKAKDMLKDFIVVCETESQYGRGNNGTGLIDELKTEYDANGNPVKITKLGSNRDIQTVTQMSYDKDNNLLSKDIYYSGAENPKISIKYTYDENGWLIKEFHTDRSENSLNLEQTFEYVYDSHGNVVEKRTTNFFGFEAVEVVKYVLKYDEKGRLIEKYNEEEPEYVTYYSYYDDGTLKKEWSDGWLKEYDENGNIVKSDTGDEKDDYVYNADGKLLKHTCDDGKSVTVYEYTYDENGYLVKKTADSDEYGVTTWQYYNDAYGNPEKMALTYDSGKDDGYIYHYKGYKYFYRPQKKSEGNSEKNPNDSVQKDYIDDLFAAEFVEYEDLGKYENCVKFVSDKEYNVMSVLITPKTTIYDFRIYSLVDNIDTVTLENILFEAKSISADKPLLAEIEFGDILAENGISFTDENGNEYLYKLVDNPYDGKLIVYDVTAEASEESKGTLIVNGIDITKGSGVKIYDDRAELPFVAIMEALGISFEWKTDSTAIMTYGSIRPYLLDVKKGELTDYVGGDGRNHFTAYSDSSLEFSPLEKEILIDNINASAFFSEMGFVFRISYFDINFKDKIISIGRDTNDYQCTLIVNGNDITVNKCAVMKRDDGNYTLLSFVPIMEELGAKFEWESDYVAKIEFRGKIFTLNIEECELIAEGNNVNLISPVPGGTRKSFADKKALTVDDVTLKQFFDIVGINALYNYDEKIVTISKIFGK